MLIPVDRPGDVKVWVMWVYTRIRGRLEKIIGFILDNGSFTGDNKPMGKAPGNKELEVVVSRQADSNMPSQRMRIWADINCYIEYLSLNYTN